MKDYLEKVLDWLISPATRRAASAVLFGSITACVVFVFYLGNRLADFLRRLRRRKK